MHDIEIGFVTQRDFHKEAACKGLAIRSVCDEVGVDEVNFVLLAKIQVQAELPVWVIAVYGHAAHAKAYGWSILGPFGQYKQGYLHLFELPKRNQFNHPSVLKDGGR